MAGWFRRLYDALWYEEVVDESIDAARRTCALCAHWIEPGRLTAQHIPSLRAIQWAQKGGYGRCQAPRPAADDDDKKRLTKSTASCAAWSFRGLGGAN